MRSGALVKNINDQNYQSKAQCWLLILYTPATDAHMKYEHCPCMSGGRTCMHLFQPSRRHSCADAFENKSGA